MKRETAALTATNLKASTWRPGPASLLWRLAISRHLTKVDLLKMEQTWTHVLLSSLQQVNRSSKESSCQRLNYWALQPQTSSPPLSPSSWLSTQALASLGLLPLSSVKHFPPVSLLLLSTIYWHEAKLVEWKLQAKTLTQCSQFINDMTQKTKTVSTTNECFLVRKHSVFWAEQCWEGLAIQSPINLWRTHTNLVLPSFNVCSL